MAKGRYTGGRQFQKGVSGNPSGRPAMPDTLKALQKNSKQIILQNICDLILKPQREVKQIAEMGSTMSGVALMASVLHKGIEMGCTSRAQFFMNYLIGKPTEYDPETLEETDEEKTKALETVPSEALTRVLREAAYASHQSVPK